MKNHDPGRGQGFHVRGEERKNFRYTMFESIDLNSASYEGLRRLRGIGANYAARIIERRPYCSIDAVLVQAGIPNHVLQRIRSQITLK